eukprot:gene3607-13691_t
MVKAYLRYEATGVFGVICSSANPVYAADGKTLFTGCLENVSHWNLKQGELVKSLAPDAASTSSGSTSPSEVTVMARAPFGSKVAVGYSDGVIRLWDTDTSECVVTFKGHKSAVTAIRFNSGGSLLASGSKDTDLIVWDVLGETGMYRLRGHMGQVTDLVFVARGNRLVWDLETQHCSQTITGYKAEVWTLDVDPDETRLITGATDQELRVYSIHEDSTASLASENPDAEPSTATKHVFLKPMGSLRRQGNDRVAAVRFNEEGNLLACQGAGKTVELFRVRSEEEAMKKLKRRKKRRREKDEKKKGKKGTADGVDSGSDDGDGADEGDVDASTLKASDEMQALAVIAVKQRIKGVAFAPAVAVGEAAKRKKGTNAQIAISLANNCVEVVDIDTEGVTSVVQKLELAGHRTDIRALTLSSDDQLLLSSASSALKVWNPQTGVCVATMESGYGLCTLFVPGNRHAVLGTKEGTLEIFDLAAADRVHVEEGAHDGAVWSLAALPDKSGFVSGSADKSVKFWQWSVVVTAEGAKELRLTNTRTLKMADDVLCVKVSPDGKLIAVSLLDATIKIFFVDTLKFFLSLYGHKLPVLCLDISSDNTLLVSGSADKNIKVWGLDFGDCHKSLFAHQDAVMQASFVHGTHYCFTVGKDRLLKYWDLDRMEMLMEMPGHHSEVWALAVSSHDRSIRRWERSQEPFFVEEEREKRLESLFEADLERVDANADAGDLTGAKPEEGSVAPAGRRNFN